MKLSAEQKDTLHTIYTAAEGAGPVRYSAKQLAPTVRKENAPRYIANLESAGYLERHLGEMGRTMAVSLTLEGVRVAIQRRKELMPVIAALLDTNPPTEGDLRRQKAFLPLAL